MNPPLDTNSKHSNVKTQVTQHLTEWFRGLGLETHQIENSTDKIIDIFATELVRMAEEALPKKAIVVNSNNIGTEESVIDFARTEAYNKAIAETRTRLTAIIERELG